MAITYYKKLIRDRIPEIISSRGLRCKLRRLTARRYEKALREKLLEEAVELRAAKGKGASLNELIDLQELVDACRQNLGVGPKRFRELVKRKRKERGGFKKRLFLVCVKESSKDSKKTFKPS